MDRILTIAYKELYSMFSDRARTAFLLITPLAIATIIGLAFGGQSGNLTISDISVAVVNLDEGATSAGDNTNYGVLISDILLSQTGDDDANASMQPCPLLADETDADGATAQRQSLDDLLNAIALDDPDAARSGVDDGTYRVAVVIPAGFSAALQPQTSAPSLQTLFSGSDDAATPDQVTVEIYGSGSSPVSAQVVRSVVEGVVGQIVTGSTAIRVTIDNLAASPANLPRLLTASDDDFAAFGCGFDPALNTIDLTRIPLDDIQVETPFVQIVVAFGAAQAMFFSLFTANAAVQSIYQDRKTWILQRLLVSPNPRWTILAGKLTGMLLIVLVQVGLLMIALNIVAWVVTGELTLIWGSNLLLIVLLLLAAALAVSGVAVFVTGIARSEQQANILGTLVSMALAVLGGAFGFSLGEGISQLSIIYWGVTGFQSLSAGSTDIALNLLVLTVQGALLFAIGAWLFNRQIEV